MPKRVARARKDGHVHANDEDEAMTLLDTAPRSSRAQVSTQSQTPVKKPVTPGNDSATEDEEEKEEVAKPASPNHLPTPSRSLSPPGAGLSPPGVNLEREPGRIVGSAFPLKDFKENITQGDVVSKAVEDLAYVIRDVVKKPFAKRRHGEMVECMRELREVCLKVSVLVIIASWANGSTGRRD